MMIARINLGEILIDNGQLDQAMIIFQQSLKFSSAAPGKYSALESLFYKEISEIYLAKNQLDEAQQYLQKVSKRVEIHCYHSTNLTPIFEWRICINAREISQNQKMN